MEKSKVIWHVELYDKYSEGEHLGDEYFAREDAARLYIATHKLDWEEQGIIYSLGGETLWL